MAQVTMGTSNILNSTLTWFLTYCRFFQSPDGTEIWNVYHADANSAGACDGTRYTMAQKVNWNSDNTPNFGSPGALGTKITGPSGE
jgi:GH43 family beta-xylosidase